MSIRESSDFNNVDSHNLERGSINPWFGVLGTTLLLLGLVNETSLFDSSAAGLVAVNEAACRSKGAYDLGDILDPEAPDNYLGSPIGKGYRRNSNGVAVPDADYGESIWMEGQAISGYYYNATDGCYYPVDVD